ncbi:iron-containing alcohol dehydrogenase [Halocella sp. SP3-1]|uniref:iron-containing alcohol dehydrogenase n=1 Tax=Halocella sp. SP3-1 TaxID=2382161 RepID=UPI000F75EDD4|nr:iron-containing alcohol dehydrogenase [Halocella sp. SP3-1]AZO96804.1 iron-containing alcohol dehydrogenase [Halocella sp. SP3-1]
MARYAQACPIIYGEGSLNLLGNETKKLGCSKVMVVSDKEIIKLDFYSKALKNLKEAGIKVVEFSKIIPDPPDYIINEGGKLAQKEDIDGIIAIGGGSPMDAAKAINILVNNPLPINNYFGQPVYNPGVPVIMISTTAGTGSESTSIAVVTDTSNNAKNSVICNASLGILDPETTLTLPVENTANTGIDTLAHAAEAITAKEGNPKSELLAKDAIIKVINNLPLAISDPRNLVARSNLLIASNFAGIAFNDSLVHLGHAIAHAIGAKFHITHGVICGLALPEVMIYAAGVKAEKVKIVAEAMGIIFKENENSSKIAEKAAKSIREFLKKVNIKSCKELDIPRDEFIGTAKMVISDPCYQFIPKKLNEREVKNILEKIYDNY